MSNLGAEVDPEVADRPSSAPARERNEEQQEEEGRGE